MKKLVFTFLLFSLAINCTNACTTFVLKDSTHLIYGRNFDWDIGSGFIVINRKGMAKKAFVRYPYKPVQWVSKYGSITFNQIGIDAPMGGMNEKGLVIAQMGLFESKYPDSDNEPVVNGFEWIQYQLDNSSTVAEVIEKSKKISIVSDIVPVHYLICDSLGDLGVIEFLNGALVIHQGDDVSVPVCSNMIYEQSQQAIKNYKGLGGQKDIPVKWNNVPDIVAIVTSKINNYQLKSTDNNPVAYGFEILDAVSSETRTQWSIIFDIKNKKINFKTLNNKNIRTLDVTGFEYTCDVAIHILDIQKSNNETDLHDQFTNLTFDSYFRYKKNLIALYKEKMEGFPDIPDAVIKHEVEYALNRKCE